jgi:REP element-mobilizing transposase RayT
MPRRPRLHVPGGLYHVVLRGNHRQRIFDTRGDRERLDEIVSEVLGRFGARLHAYCWMSNHVHLLPQVADAPLGQLMHRIASRYARQYQARLRTTGHLFERRYRAWLVDADEYLLELVRYIHLNPVRAGLVTDPAEYEWSGHLTYLGTRNQPWLCTDFVLRMFHDDAARAAGAYRAFVLAGVQGSRDASLYRGHAQEPRALGSDRFIQALASAPAAPRPCKTLDDLAAATCQAFGVSIDALRSPGKQRLLSAARRSLALHAREQRVASLSDVARYLHRSVSGIARLVEQARRPPRSGPHEAR